MSDFYEVLGVSKTAGQDELRSAYRALAVRWHPDKHHGQTTAEDRFKRISEAYAVLSNPEKRADYNRQLESGSPYSAFEMDYDQSMSLFFEQMIYLARDLTMDNVGYRKIASRLAKRGCPTAVALQIARIIEVERKGSVRKQSGFNVRYAVLMLCIGAFLVLFGIGLLLLAQALGPGLGILTSILYAVLSVAFLSGALVLWMALKVLVPALYHLLTGRY